jgi:beta-galactosidase
MQEKKNGNIGIHAQNIAIEPERFRIGNEEIFLRAGEMHYFRIVPSEWEDRIQKLVDLGMNAISTYVPWNWHEPHQGNFDFTSDTRNLENFLNLCEQYKLYILIRPGPWICSEWRYGAIPDWIFDQIPDIFALNYDRKPTPMMDLKAPVVSYLHPIYLEYVEKWYDQVCPIIARYQYPQGKIILMQLDNEISFGFHSEYETADFNPINLPIYQQWLKNKYIKIEALNLAYLTNYSEFEIIPFPSFETTSFTERSPKNLLVFLDWAEFKEYILERFIKILASFARKNDVKIPLYLNMAITDSPYSPIRFRMADPDGIMIGIDYYPNEFHDQEKGDLEAAYNSEMLKAWYSHIPFFPEFQGGNFNRKVASQTSHILQRLTLAHGMKAFAMYMTVGGTNPERMSSVKKTLSPNGWDLEGNSYDFAAPIGELGQRNNRYETVQQFNEFIKFHQAKLMLSQKIYDNVTWVHYFPYTRVKDLPWNVGFDGTEGTKNFGFPQNYVYWPSFSRYYLQLFNNLNILPDFVELWGCEPRTLKQKKILILYTLGWMYHEDMVKLQEYVRQGGILITIGDIPHLNEYFEPDGTLANLYEAISRGESNRDECVWNAETSEINIPSIEKLFKFELTPVDNARILAHNGDFQEVFAFAREFELGKIIHTGIIPPPVQDSYPYILALLEAAEFTFKNNSASQECILVQTSCPSGDRFIYVGNLQHRALEHVSFNFNYIQDETSKPLEIDDMIIPARSILIWHADFSVSHDILIEYCTAEITALKHENQRDINLILRFPYYPTEPDKKKAKISLILTDKTLKIQKNKGDFILKQTLTDSGFKILIEVNDFASFSIQNKSKRFIFSLEPYALPGDD